MINRRHFVTFTALTCLSFITTVGCASNLSPSSSTADAAADAEAGTEPSGSTKLTISVAASVQDAMKEIQTAYQAVDPTVTIVYNFGSSGSLAQQISQGAPADIFLSASLQWMDDLDTSGQIAPETRQNILQNAMVLIVPSDKETMADFKDLGTENALRVAMGEPDSVPAGRYAKEVLTSMNLLDSMQSKLVFGKDVRQVLSYVETGNVDAGLVYATDAQVSDQVRVIATAPADSHSPIVYPIAMVQDSENSAAAQEFLDFLRTEDAIAIFESYGFTMAE
jgi:molybdate transport system substrate-binding protein